MTSISSLSRLRSHRQPSRWNWPVFIRHSRPKQRPDLYQLARQPDLLPSFVRQSAVGTRYINLLGSLDSVWHEIFGQHGTRDVQRENYVDALGHYGLVGHAGPRPGEGAPEDS